MYIKKFMSKVSARTSLLIVAFVAVVAALSSSPAFAATTYVDYGAQWNYGSGWWGNAYHYSDVYSNTKWHSS